MKTAKEIVLEERRAKQLCAAETDDRTASEVVVKVAHTLLRAYYRNITTVEFRKLLDEANYYEIMSRIQAESYLDVVIELLTGILLSRGVALPEHFDDMVFFSTDIDTDFAECQRQCEALRLNNGEKADIAFQLTAEVHKLWA